WMDASVSAHEGLVPIRRGTVGVVLLKGRVVVDPFITEHSAKRFQPRRISDQLVPIVMAYLVTKMAEQRPVRLMHGHPPLFTLHIVGFVEIDRNQAVFMPGHHAG